MIREKWHDPRKSSFHFGKRKKERWKHVENVAVVSYGNCRCSFCSSHRQKGNPIWSRGKSFQWASWLRKVDFPTVKSFRIEVSLFSSRLLVLFFLRRSITNKNKWCENGAVTLFSSSYSATLSFFLLYFYFFTYFLLLVRSFLPLPSFTPPLEFHEKKLANVRVTFNLFSITQREKPFLGFLGTADELSNVSVAS